MRKAERKRIDTALGQGSACKGLQLKCGVHLGYGMLELVEQITACYHESNRVGQQAVAAAQQRWLAELGVALIKAR